MVNILKRFKQHDESLDGGMERAANISQFLIFASSKYVLPLFLFFGIADWIWYGEYFSFFVSLRIATAISIFAIGKFLKPSFSLKQTQLLSTAFLLCGVIPLHVMVAYINDPGTPYYAGIMLMIIGMSTGLRLTWASYFLNLALMVLPLCVIGAVKLGFSFVNYFYLNIIFLLSVSLISSVGRYFLEDIYLKERISRLMLKREIESRNIIIEQKTAESVKLHSLSRQFSPQIISSIRSGQLSLDSGIHRTDLCAIFIDIKDSTVKFIALDRDDIQKVLSLYMEDVMGTLLKYDITIDKFLGDGVLAFTNDPVKQDDYIERAILAAAEIIDRIQNKADLYSKYWLSEFEVRVGVATGYASVGFYGSDLHVKSYTAIGRVINLVNRVNGVAPVNGIAISKDVITKLQDKGSSVLRDFEIEEMGTPALKGFEREKIILYSIKKKIQKNSSNDNNGEDQNPVCPHGHGLLYLAQDEDNIYRFKCRYCDFIHDDQGSTPLIKKSA